MSIPEREADIYREDLPRRLPLLLVSKTFHKLALPYYYSVVHFKYPSVIPKFRHILLNHPTVGPQVHAIWGSLGQPSAQGQDQMATILSLTTRLEKFHRRQESFHHDTISPYCDSYSEEYIHRNYHEVSILSCFAFQAMAKASGSTLREFSQEVSGGRWSHCTVFDHFTQLTSLDWKGRTEFISPELHCNGLRNLTDLRIWYLNPSFLTMLESMKLPSLRRLALSKKVTDASKFLKLCGNILTELDLTLEALTALSVHFDCGYRGINLPHVTDFVLDDTKHQHLHRVKFDLAELNSRHINNWDDFRVVYGQRQSAR
ncbi:hypothetical protein MVEN_01946800 [Mycena venus]|uniref:Uncharacterized protein n=1 Tax=Mycena venus TaxID=2733690 RepID=A0A8H6XF38_9AGAR|nr:hypothetical protein MVEN_01946800 [Mycena venus]